VIERYRIMRLVRSQPIPERLIAALRRAPLVPEEELVQKRPKARDRLADAERAALTCASHGLDAAMTAEVLGKSVHTIKDQLRTARYILRAKNTAHAVALALRAGLID
jgi:DNA-binding CsgD family transcriptional regulator